MEHNLVYMLPLSFFINNPSHTVKRAVDDLIAENTKFELVTKMSRHPISNIPFRSTTEVPVAEFCCRTVTGNSTGFLLKDYTRFLELCAKYSVRESELNIHKFKPIAPVSVDFGLENFTPRPKQVPAIKHLEREGDKTVSVLFASTGFGKSVLGLYMMGSLKVRTMFSMNPSHLNTWRNSLKQFTNVTDDDIYTFTGGDSIRKAIALARKGEFNYKIILTSAATTRSFIKQYENAEGNFNFDETPAGIWNILGIGLIVRDEVHEAIHTLVKQTIYCTVPKSLYLSATLISDDRFINGIYDKVFPQSARWKSEDNKYLMMHPLFYGANKPISGKGFKGYSHVSYEKSIMRTKGVLARYLNLVAYTVDLWEKEYKEGKKMFIIASTVLMCEHILAKVREAYPKYSSDMFIQGSPKEHLYERDIVIGTPGSIGTGVDVPNLSMVVLTTAIGSTQRSIQIAGRPREIKRYPEDSPRFVYFVNNENGAHMKYHEKRLMYMTMRIRGKKDVFTNYRI